MIRQILTLSCKDQPGIVAAVSSAIARHGGNILDAQQHGDCRTCRFFMRVDFEVAEAKELALRAALGEVATVFGMALDLINPGRRQSVLLLVSKFHHCLVDLLYRSHIGELAMDIVGVISNHPLENFAGVQLCDIPFHYLPVSNDTRRTQEAQIKQIAEQTGAELVVLARYMQVLSDDLAAWLWGRCINIHHSFLPGFKGAKPYHQAHARGVKLIGATAHYVTSDLDEGAIIEQDVERISHADTPVDLIRKGRDIERRVLARAVKFHLERRALLNENTTVIFRD